MASAILTEEWCKPRSTDATFKNNNNNKQKQQQQQVGIGASSMEQQPLNNNNNEVTKCKYDRVQEIDPPAVPPVAILRLPILQAFSSTSRFGSSFTS